MEESYGALMGVLPFYTVTHVDETDSTNARVRDWAMRGADEGAVLIASRQSEGRGRLGRRFFSPAGTGLYLSVLLRPAFDVQKTPLITTAAAVAVCRAIRQTGRQAMIKWVNDVYLDGRKVCGILTEGVPGQYAVLGVGVNLIDPPDGFPQELLGIAGSVFGKSCEKEAGCELAVRILNEFCGLYRALPDQSFMDEYRAMNLVPGRRVTLLSDPPCEAEALAVLDDGALLLRMPDGTERRIASGEISVRLL